MILVRLISVIFLAVALMSLGADCVTSLEMPSDAFHIRSLDTILALLDASPKAWIDATLPGFLAGALGVLLAWPAWAVVGVPGIILSLISARGD